MLLRGRGPIVAPHLIDLEIAQVLRRYESLGIVDEPRAQLAFADADALGIRRYAHDLLLPRIWDPRHDATASDAAYLVLAEALRAPLLTTDGKLAAVPGTHATVEWVQ